MWRHLIPRVECGRWGGAALIDPCRSCADGWCVCVQWLGFVVELGAGAITRDRP